MQVLFLVTILKKIRLLSELKHLSSFRNRN